MTKPAPFADARGRMAVRAGHLLDVESGATFPDRTILVSDGRVEAVLAPGDGLPDGLPVLDLPGLTVLPGFIDTHGHLVGEVQTAGVPATLTSGAQEAMLSVRNARVTVRAGFTTIRDLGPFRAFTDRAVRDTIDAGEIEGPRMAECMGWSERVGALAPGRFADLVAVEGDPLSDITLLERPVIVLTGGRPVLDLWAGA